MLFICKLEGRTLWSKMHYTNLSVIACSLALQQGQQDSISADYHGADTTLPRDVFNPDDFFVSSEEDEQQDQQQAELALGGDDLLGHRLESVGLSALGVNLDKEAIYNLIIGQKQQP